ncbi:MAG: hypothetical protein QOE93_1511 [Actinomycetota bacterium]|nr:hypothetical protein [Actinomycetota bacterium]
MTDDRRAANAWSPAPADDNAARAVVRALKTALGKAGSLTASGLIEAVEAPARTLGRRAAESAVAAPRPLSDERSLARALAERPGAPLLGNTAAAALAARLARRFGPLKFLTRRTPMWVVAAAGPALYASVNRGADEIGMVASHLVHRIRAAGMQPDPERVRRAAVQIVSGTTVDTGADPSHGPLVLSWLTRAVKAALPFGASISTREPTTMAAAAAAVPPAVVARADEMG